MTTRQPPSPSLIDVARAAGVSTATAGRALGGYGQVRAGTRERVLTAAAELGYRTNGLARSMITGSTQTIGVVVTDVANPFFAIALRGITDVVQPAGFEVLLANTAGALVAEQRALTVMSEKRVDGVIVAAAQPSEGAHLEHAIELGVPIVLLDRQVTGAADADSITIDNEHAAGEAVTHLLELGHRRIGLVTEAGEQLPALLAADDRRGGAFPSAMRLRGYLGALGAAGLDVDERLIGSARYDRDSAYDATTRLPALLAADDRRGGAFPSAMRLRGYLGALDAAGLDVDERLIGSARYDRDSAYDATTRLLDLDDPPTAVLCTDNVLATGAFRAAQDRGLRMPGQLSLIGFDDEPWTTLVRPELTIVEQPTYELGTRAGQQLLDRISGGRERRTNHVQLRAKLVVRGSTGPV